MTKGETVVRYLGNCAGGTVLGYLTTFAACCLYEIIFVDLPYQYDWQVEVSHALLWKAVYIGSVLGGLLGLVGTYFARRSK